MSSLAAHQRAVAYCRVARRLRARRRGQRLHDGLCAAAAQANLVAMQAAGVWPADPGRALEVLVERSLEGPVLRYSRRVALLEHAARLGIRRFDANLIIAGVQQRCSDSRALGPRPYRRTMWPGVALAMSVQMTLVLLAWFALG